jgi:hypothetical protein
MQSLKAIKSTLVVLLFFFSGFALADSAQVAPWKKIEVAPGTYHTTDGNGASREIAPSCSGGPVCTFDAAGKPTCHLGDKQFSFYFKPGKEDKLIVYFDGGGACWDSNTCVTGQQTPLSAYTPEPPTAQSSEGLFDANNPKNPYRDWSIALIPYCTGDIHWGSKDQDYTDFSGAVTGTPGGTVTIHHRGFDNFLYVRDWLMKRYAQKGKKQAKENDGAPEKLLVTGSSAGGYGAAFAYPHLKQAFPKASGYLMADAANGVVSEALLQQALRLPEARWGATDNLVHAIPGMDGVFDLPPDRFAQGYYASLAGYYPHDRFSQYSTLFDVIQALFYNISLNQNDIAAWGDISPQVYGAWTQQMVNGAYVTAANPNYRFYIAPGCNHTLLRFNDDFYNTQSGQDPSFLSWFKALTKEGEDGAYPAKWSNSFCDGCDIPPTPQEVGACLQRSLRH